MSSIFGKKQAVLAVLVAALGVAVYLNYYFSVQQPDVLEAGADTTTTTASEADDGKNLGDAQYVNNPSTTPSETEATEPAGDDYFAQARQSREEAREEALDIVKDAMNDVKGDEASRQAALEKAAAIASAVEKENAIESLVKAKGFDDCVAYLTEGECQLVVNGGEPAAIGSGPDYGDRHHTNRHCRLSHSDCPGEMRKSGCSASVLLV